MTSGQPHLVVTALQHGLNPVGDVGILPVVQSLRWGTSGSGGGAAFLLLQGYG